MEKLAAWHVAEVVRTFGDPGETFGDPGEAFGDLGGAETLDELRYPKIKLRRTRAAVCDSLRAAPALLAASSSCVLPRYGRFEYSPSHGMFFSATYLATSHVFSYLRNIARRSQIDLSAIAIRD